MAEQDDHFTLNFTPTKQKLPNEFRLITSPPNKKEFDLYNQLLNSPAQKKLFSYQIQNQQLSQNSSYPSERSDSISIQISEKSQEQQNKELAPIVENIKTNLLLATPNKVFKGCHCEKSKCSKKYCDCYRAGKVCGEDCNCVGCENSQFTQKHKRNLKEIEMTKSGKGNKEMKCNCKKSHCVKNYCECHNMGKYCSESCNCVQCDNRVQSNFMNGRKRKPSENMNISMWEEQQNKENILFNQMIE